VVDRIDARNREGIADLDRRPAVTAIEMIWRRLSMLVVLPSESTVEATGV
jgi:hypothetical protein